MLFIFVHGCDEVLFRYPQNDLCELKFRSILKELVFKVQLCVGVKPFFDIFGDMKQELKDRFGCVEQKGFGYKARQVVLVFDVLKGLGFILRNSVGEKTGSFYPLHDELEQHYLEEKR